MIPLVSREEMLALEATSAESGANGAVLMERAGRAAAEALFTLLAPTGRCRGVILVVCGGGNNGGDGFEVARVIAEKSAFSPVVCMATKAENLSGDALSAWHKARAQSGIRWLDFSNGVAAAQDLDIASDEQELKREISAPIAIVDALLGTGAKPPMRAAAQEIIAWMNRFATKRLAVDLPSGLCANGGSLGGDIVRADVTVTFGSAKWGHADETVADCIGLLRLAQIGIPTPTASQVQLLERADILPDLPARSPQHHKGMAGRVLILGGTAGKVGAPILAARAALRGGAGLVAIGAFEPAASVIEGLLPEVMVERLFEGTLPNSAAELCGGSDGVVLGPGMDTGARGAALVAAVLANAQCPVICDADALNHLSRDPVLLDVLRSSPGERVLTPHWGEMARLAGVSIDALRSDRIPIARSFAMQNGCTLLLKGPRSLVVTRLGEVFVNSTGNATLATGGTGDVLAGLLGALVSACDPKRTIGAVCSGLFWHGAAADRWRAKVGVELGALASEIADELVPTLAELRRGVPPYAQSWLFVDT